MNNNEYNHKIEHIYHMNSLIRSLNNENSIMAWLSNGVPDGVNSIEELKDTYDNDEYFEDDYNDLVNLFCRIICRESKNGSNTNALFW